MKRVALRIRNAARPLTAGFTLVELMVAVTGGLFVSIAVFMLARQATQLYQSEIRVSNATLGTVIGFERLRSDVSRAGFLSTPNIRRDPNRCGDWDTGWPAALQRLAAIQIQRTATVPQILKDNGRTPDEILLAGSYATTDVFPTTDTGGIQDTSVYLRTDSQAFAHLNYAALTTTAQQQAALLSVFGVNRIIRIQDQTGKEQYAVVAGVQPGPQPFLTLRTIPALLHRDQSPLYKCGVAGLGVENTLVNPVNLIRYSLRDMTTVTRYAPLFQGAPPTDSGRTELVREEIDADGNPVANTDEIVSEFAVDLAFGITVAEVITGTTQTEQLTAIPDSKPDDVKKWAGDISTIDLTKNGPQLVRVVRARLSVRSREADRSSGMPANLTDGGLPIGPGFYRMGLGPGGIGPYARVRTVQADIVLRNQREATWL